MSGILCRLLYTFLFLLFVTGDHCSCFSDNRFQPDTAIFKSDGSDVYAYILCTWCSQHLTTTCIVCTHKLHCHQTRKWPYRAETGRLGNRSSGLQLQIIGTTRYTIIHNILWISSSLVLYWIPHDGSITLTKNGFRSREIVNIKFILRFILEFICRNQVLVYYVWLYI